MTTSGHPFRFGVLLKEASSRREWIVKVPKGRGSGLFERLHA